MPRDAREKSNSGYYHVLLRGIGRQNIFEDDEDNKRFIETMLRYKQELKFEINAYCLMGNHVHILLKDRQEQLDLIMKKIAGSYAYYYNTKYDRAGHLFQDRYKSEAVEDDEYYLTVLRYIHQNPKKAGISSIDKYEWSSYKDYIDNTSIIETKYALEMLGGIDSFIEFLNTVNDDICLEASETNKMNDKKAKEILINEYGIESFSMIQKLSKDERNLILRSLRSRGLSVRHLARLTGINRGIIQNAKM